MIRKLFAAFGVGALILFVWRGWGEEGRLSDFLIMLWEWFFMVIDAMVVAAESIFSQF